MRIALFLLLLAVPVLSAPPVRSAPAGTDLVKVAVPPRAAKTPESLKVLQGRFDALNADAGRALLRENWLRIIEDCTALAAASKGEAQARAAFLAARAREEMSNRSYNGADRRRAIGAYAALAGKFPRSDLAPVSLYRQAYLLGVPLGRAEEASAVLAVLLRQYPQSQAARDGKALQARLAAAVRPPAAKNPSAAAGGKKPAPAAQASSPKTGDKKNASATRTPPEKAAGKKTAPAVRTSPEKTAGKKPARAADRGSPEKAPASVMEQLGLTVRTIMLDPGHGGKDPGCMANKLVEKDFTLRMAKLIGARLEKKGFTVLYTRSGDQFISLPDRPDLANKKGADLFISLHINANPSASVRGLETYYLSEAKTGDAARVAARENGVSPQNISDLQVILTDLMLHARLEESRALAQCAQRAILGGLRKAGLPAVDGGVRSAPFYVLMGARMPAILVEFGYASNSREAANLRSEKFLQRQADGLVDGILAYKEQLAKSVK
jgi:N-acetylmuramoyl-L-alanine amidase